LADERALIFDLDDTLYPEMEYVRSGFRAVASGFSAAFGLATEEMYGGLERTFSSGPPLNVFDRWLGEQGLSGDEFLESMIEVFRNHKPSLHLFSDAKWALDNTSADYHLALLTDGRSTSQRYKIEALGIERFFQAIVVTDELGIASRKPDSRGFEVIVAELGVAPARSVYVGDNPAKDFLGARRVGMSTIRVRRLCGRHREVEPPSRDYAPDAEITTLFELPDVLSILMS
jgi:putative hydrolase of the HAD superfamily